MLIQEGKLPKCALLQPKTSLFGILNTVKPVLTGHSKRRPNAGQGEHSAILSTFIKLSFVFKTFVLSIFEWPLKTGFNVVVLFLKNVQDCRLPSVKIM